MKHFSIAVLLWLGCVTLACADVKYTTEIHHGESGRGMKMQSTTYVKGQRQRVETSFQAGPMSMNSVELTLCDKHVCMSLDSDLKLYTVKPVTPGAPMGMAHPPMMRPPAVAGQSVEKSGTGKAVISFDVLDLGTEKLHDLETHHYMLTMRTVETGCRESDTTFKFEEWVAAIPTLNCPDRVAAKQETTEHDGGERGGCHMQYEMKGDLAKLGSIYSGMPVRLKMYHGDQVAMEQDLVDYSSAALDDALFTPPPDYRQVSDSEFAQAQQQKMMRNMMHHRD